MEKKEIYEKHKKYLVPCVATYYKEPLTWIGERENLSMILMGRNISIFLEALSPSVWVIVMMRLPPRPVSR